ncbi:helix-turn-helix transcriptional regulator [Halomonas sp. LBP4]|uniref:helix-turn-helix transcriptional regulator n=1 Tax=Halomonas sp. LBP4 TaxID=2044917 RepID=UPI000D77354D|nr:helix-turn-helix domain-containing protein [Halomonas sp. LBP4]PXX97361.1 AlpA family transcriptional regulator [Halomonas sp. LBP4]
MTYLTVKQLSARYGVSVPSVWRWAREGDFPQPVRLSKCCTRWRLDDIEAWEASRKEEA